MTPDAPRTSPAITRNGVERRPTMMSPEHVALLDAVLLPSTRRLWAP